MIDLTSRIYEKHRRKGMKTNEGYVYVNPRNRKQIIKVIEPTATIPGYIDIKKYTIKLLLENKEYFRELKIAYPEESVRIDMIPRAYAAKNIEGLNLESALSHPTTALGTKIDYLKQVGTILRKMEEIRKQYPHLSNFYYNDIHENNFLVTRSETVYGIDLDSCSIQDNIPVCGLYPLNLPKIKRLNKKYQSCPQICEYSTPVIPDKNLDLYSYTIMILNFMCGISLNIRWNPTNLDEYLNYLEKHGANLEFLYILSYIYDESVENENPDFLLDCIKEIYPYSNIRYDETGTLRKILR